MNQKSSSKEETIVSNFDSMFGERKCICVKYPGSWSAKRMTIKLDWAKTWVVESLQDDSVIIRAIVKPNYVDHFIEENKEYLVPHKKMDFGYEIENCIYS